MLKFKQDLKRKILDTLEAEYPVDRDKFDLNETPDVRFGDLALTFPFQLAKALKRSPRDIANEIAPKLSGLEGISHAEIAGGGYINLHIDRNHFFSHQLSEQFDKDHSAQPVAKKIIVEHTSINPNKAAHIGHLRNSCLGDTLARCLIFMGKQVEIQNYIDDTGVQVADVVFGFLELENMSLEQVRAIPGKFDYYCWDLYTYVSSYLESQPEAQKRKSEILKKIEEGAGIEAEMAQHISRRILHCHLRTMARLDIHYDLQACESSIIALKFWEQAFRLLKDKKALSFASEGPNKGCWVMKLEDETQQEKIIVRSNGLVTYTGKDIAYQLWKFGLLERDFHYEPFLKQKERTTWITTSYKTDHQPSFGKAYKVYNVIDVRQSYPQKIVAQGLRSLKYIQQSDNSIHFSYEMVALSPNSLKELNFEVSKEDLDKDFLEVSGRKGLGVKADDLIDRMEAKSLAEVEKRNPDLSPETAREIAHRIASGALRYFMLKFARNSILIFDFEDALSFEGETGPYLQYTLVRIQSIFRKLEEASTGSQEWIDDLIRNFSIRIESLSEKEQSDCWEIIRLGSKLKEEINHSLHSLEFLHLAKFTFNLCQKFNAYYHKYSILNESNPELKRIRILTILYIRRILSAALKIMGIPQPERM